MESLANLAETQLNTDLTYERSTADSETRRNTQLNKFASYSEEHFNSELDKMVGAPKHIDLKPNIVIKDEVDSERYYGKDYSQTSRSHIINSSTSYTRRDATEDGAFKQTQHSFLSSKPPRETVGALNSSLIETDATHSRFRYKSYLIIILFFLLISLFDLIIEHIIRRKVVLAMFTCKIFQMESSVNR